nr:MAG: hypothetical protein H2BulkLitter121867_000001 [Mitovirus sp.]
MDWLIQPEGLLTAGSQSSGCGMKSSTNSNREETRKGPTSGRFILRLHSTIDSAITLLRVPKLAVTDVKGVARKSKLLKLYFIRDLGLPRVVIEALS